MSAAKYWLLAIRPKTLSLAVVPVIVGSALAWHDQGQLNIAPLAAALLAALFIQIGTNLHNDASDFERGTDTPDRLGPRRAAAQGWFSVEQIRQAALISFSSAFLLGVYLVWVGGLPIMLLGLASLAAGYAYTGGPRPIAYTPFGELFVLFFFGVAAVAGSYFLQTLAVTEHASLAGLAIGLPAAAVLMVNNYRDLETDARAGRKTLVALLGRQVSRFVFAVALILPFALIEPILQKVSYPWLPWLASPIALLLIIRLRTQPIDPGFNKLLAMTAQYQLALGLLFAVALML